MAYTNVTKPIGTSYTNANAIGKEQYDQSNLTYDSSVTYYDGLNFLAYTNVAKPEVAWNISRATFTNTFSVTSQTTRPEAVFFKPTGLKMYVIDATSTRVLEYDLSTAWDISTSVFLQALSVAAKAVYAGAIFFKPDGTKMYVTDSDASGNKVNEYDLSTAWNISTAVWLQSFTATQPEGIYFSPDGTQMFTLSSANYSLNQYSLSEAWNVSTSTLIQSKVISTLIPNPDNLFFRYDGKKIYVTSASVSKVYELDLIEAWNISTLVSNQTYTVSASDIDLFSVFFKPDGLSFYVTVATGDAVRQYDLSGTYTNVAKPI
jgi:DNA-binding beta-propeller fold protein YncE